MINSRNKGAVNERAWASICTNEGYPAHRTAQVAGNFNAISEGVPDVICASLPLFHFEVKAGARPHLWNAVEQAIRDKKTEQFAIAALHKDRHPWMVGMPCDDFFRLVRGDHL
jgi:Holliday junction resolvase|tara:strand:+ start:5231 stop:5569 length:339 start_codon:yes stop_codon:yes gene_type:complete